MKRFAKFGIEQETSACTTLSLENRNSANNQLTYTCDNIFSEIMAVFVMCVRMIHLYIYL